MTTRTRTGLVGALFVGGLFLFGGLAVALLLADGKGGGEIKADGNRVSWKAPATEDEARRLATYLLAHRALQSGDGKWVELRKAGRTYEIHVPVKVGLDRDEAYVATCRGFALEASANIFAGQPVDIHLCDESMKTVRVVVAPVSPFSGR